LVSSSGNFIDATLETCFFQGGESKSAKPNLVRVLTPATPLDEAAKCALVSMDSTLKSNLSVGLPLDLLIYREGEFRSDRVVCIDEHNPYFRMIRSTWGQRLKEVFVGIEDPRWDGGQAAHPLMTPSERFETMRKIAHPSERIV
ncbi:MAG: peptidase, partial [Rubrivivax sp.]